MPRIKQQESICSVVQALDLLGDRWSLLLIREVVFGTRRFDAEASERGWARPTVYAHHTLPDHFRRYERTQGWNTAINQRQFGLPVEGFAWPADYRDPDVTYDDRLTFRAGELTFELRHARGETDDATWTWVSELGVLHPGDLFIWAVPNAGNPQKVQRYVSDWAAALRQMAALHPEILLSGHGLPIAALAHHGPFDFSNDLPA